MKMKMPLFRQDGFQLFLMNLPFLVLIFMLCYLPMYGWTYAFFDYKPGMRLSQTPFAGLKHFHKLIQDRYAVLDIIRVLKNTLLINLYGYLFAPLPMLFAMFLSELKGRKFRKAVQTLTTIPHFISWVLVYAVAYAMFSVNDGLINNLLLGLGWIDHRINFLISPEFALLKMSLWGLWKGIGWSAILYFAAISGIDPELYEAAKVDGAGRFNIMLRITLPHLLPTFFVLLILSVASFLNTGMEQYYIFSNAMNRESLEVLDLYVYNQGIVGFNYPYATAVSMLKSFVGIILMFSANSLSKAVRGFGIM